MKKMWNNLLMDAANPEASGGGGVSGGGSPAGGTSFIATPNQGSQAPAKAASPNPAPGNPGQGDAVPNNATNGYAPTDWRHGLPKELQENASIKKFTSVDALAASYINAQKLIGADKIPVPSAHTTDAEWKDIYKKLGVPEKADDYKVAFKQGVPIEEQFAKGFANKAHELGMLPKQAQAMAEWFSDSVAQSIAGASAQAENSYAESKKILEKEWGNSFELNINRANKVALELGGEDLVKMLNETGAGGNHVVVKFLAKVGEQLFKEHKFVEGEGTPGAMSPKELDAQISKLRNEPAYYDKHHPQHKTVTDEITRLYQLRYDKK